MKITVITMFPELFGSFLEGPIPRRAVERGAVRIRLIDIREYAGGCYRHIDDSTFGGGAGMVLRAKPVLDALAAAKGESLLNEPPAAGWQELAAKQAMSDGKEIPEKPGVAEGGEIPHTVVAALTPAGPLFRQETAQRYAELDHLILICGHYEGMDERIYSRTDERVSIGDYILSGGETAAMVVMDAVLRLLPGILRAESTAEESFCGRGFLEYPQYTRPADLEGDRVPEVLLSGNHEEIRRWRLRESLRATLRWRPELLEKAELTQEETAMLEELRREQVQLPDSEERTES